MEPLFENMVNEKEQKRFLDLINNLKNLSSDDVKKLNVMCDENKINFDKNNIKGIF